MVWDKDTEGRWQELTDEVIIGMKDWRLQHPKATFQEIEAALDEQLAGVRARMLQDLALASKAAKIKDAEIEDRPRCPKCGEAMESRGEDTRSLTTNYNKIIHLKRSYAICPACGAGLFPPR